MQRISSPLTTAYKRVFPAIAFSIAGLTLLVAFVCLLCGMAVPPKVFFVPVFLGTLIYFLSERFVWDLADDVRRTGDMLYVRKGTVDIQVPIASVANVSQDNDYQMPRITVWLREKSPLGAQIVFTPAGWHPFAGNPVPVVRELIRRVDQSRMERIRTKSGEPGATDNPDDAQRLREDH